MVLIMYYIVVVRKICRNKLEVILIGSGLVLFVNLNEFVVFNLCVILVKIVLIIEIVIGVVDKIVFS